MIDLSPMRAVRVDPVMKRAWAEPGALWGDFDHFTIHEVGPTVLAGPVVWAMEDAPEVMRFYADFCADASEDLTTIVQYRTLP